jgi:hypothetical protein
MVIVIFQLITGYCFTFTFPQTSTCDRSNRQPPPPQLSKSIFSPPVYTGEWWAAGIPVRIDSEPQDGANHVQEGRLHNALSWDAEVMRST